MLKSLRLQINWKILVLALVLMPVLLSLGNWQLSRAEEKRVMLGELTARQAAAPVSLNQLLKQSDVQYRLVTMTGKYDYRHQLLLDNQVQKGRVGYQVITPFVTDDGQQVLVNRGWLAAPSVRSELPKIPEVQGKVTVTGFAYKAAENPLVKRDQNIRGGWPAVIQQLDFSLLGQMPELVGIPSFTVRLLPQSVGALGVDWQAVNVMPEKHTAYAVQWFAMAAALLILTIVANVRGWRSNQKQYRG